MSTAMNAGEIMIVPRILTTGSKQNGTDQSSHYYDFSSHCGYVICGYVRICTRKWRLSDAKDLTLQIANNNNGSGSAQFKRLASLTTITLINIEYSACEAFNQEKNQARGDLYNRPLLPQSLAGPRSARTASDCLRSECCAGCYPQPRCFIAARLIGALFDPALLRGS